MIFFNNELLIFNIVPKISECHRGIKYFHFKIFLKSRKAFNRIFKGIVILRPVEPGNVITFFYHGTFRDDILNLKIHCMHSPMTALSSASTSKSLVAAEDL